MTASVAILGSMALISQQMNNYRRNARGILLRTVLLDKELLRVKKKRNRKKRSFWIRPGRSSIWWESVISGQMFLVLCEDNKFVYQKKITDQKLYFVSLTLSASCIKRTQNIFRCFMRDRMALKFPNIQRNIQLFV